MQNNIDNSKFSDYNNDWARKFETEKTKLLESFSDHFVKIEHIGSTSIPGLAAKPIIDIGVLIESIDDVPGVSHKLMSLGYAYKPTMSSVERLFFRKGSPVEYHLSVSCHQHTFWSRNILFRDYMRKHPLLIKEYRNLKISSLRITPKSDLDDLSLSKTYNQGKSEFVKKVLHLADKETLKKIATIIV